MFENAFPITEMRQFSLPEPPPLSDYLLYDLSAAASENDDAVEQAENAHAQEEQPQQEHQQQQPRRQPPPPPPPQPLQPPRLSPLHPLPPPQRIPAAPRLMVLTLCPLLRSGCYKAISCYYYTTLFQSFPVELRAAAAAA